MAVAERVLFVRVEISPQPPYGQPPYRQLCYRPLPGGLLPRMRPRDTAASPARSVG
jgi:hypothetical protein